MTQEESGFSKRLIINKKRVHNAHLIREFLDSEVYREILSKDIDDMMAVSGATKEGEYWTAGDIHRKDITPDALKYLAGYQSALIEFSMRLRKYIVDGEKAKQELQKPEEENENY